MENEMKLYSFDEHLRESLKDKKTRKEYEKLESWREILKAIIEARQKNNVTQEKLSKLTGINQSELSKIENGNRNPSISILQRIADALSMKLEIRFIPIKKGTSNP